MFITTDDFKGRPYKVGAQQDSTDFETYIDAREEKILIGLLGYELYKQLSDAVDASELEVDPVTLPERFQKLRDGADYTIDGTLYRYSGIVPLLKPAIYSDWLQQQTYKNSGNGIVRNLPPTSQQSGALAENIDDEEFRIQAWNDFVMLVGASGGFRTCSQVNSFYGFMISLVDEWVNDDEDDIWNFTPPSSKNRFGI